MASPLPLQICAHREAQEFRLTALGVSDSELGNSINIIVPRFLPLNVARASSVIKPGSFVTMYI